MQNYNIPLSEIEVDLYSSDDPIGTSASRPHADTYMAWLDFYYKKCKLPVNPFVVWRYEEKADFKKLWRANETSASAKPGQFFSLDPGKSVGVFYAHPLRKTGPYDVFRPNLDREKGE